MHILLVLVLSNVLRVSLCDTLLSVAATPHVNNTGEYFINVNSLNNVIECTQPDCYIVCNKSLGCQDAIINASASDTLTLICSNDSSCASLVLAEGPSSSTTVICSGSSSCNSATLITTPSSNVELSCIYYSSCGQLILMANEADNVRISCNGVNGCYLAEFHTENASKVLLIANDTSPTFVESELYAMNAGSVELRCEAYPNFITTQSACKDVDLYVPADAFKLKCWGSSCTGALQIYTDEPFEQADVYYNGCEYCSIVQNCFPMMSFHCDPVGDNYTRADRIYADGACSSDNCGCHVMQSAFNQSYVESFGLCSGIDDLVGDIAEIIVIALIVAGVVIFLMILFCVVCCCYCERGRQHKMNEHNAPILAVGTAPEGR